MKTRKSFAALAICTLLTLTIATIMNLHSASAQSIADCRKLVTGTYLYTTTAGDLGSFRGLVTYDQDGNVVSTTSVQSGVPSSQPFGDIQGSWKCIGSREITSTVLNFNGVAERVMN